MWRQVLPDNNHLLPNHFDIVISHVDDADIVYTYGENAPQLNSNGWTTARLLRVLSYRKWISVYSIRGEDDLLTVISNGGKVLCIPIVTFHYEPPVEVITPDPLPGMQAPNNVPYGFVTPDPSGPLPTQSIKPYHIPAPAEIVRKPNKWKRTAAGFERY